MSEGELSKFIGQYLLDNPAVLIDALDNAQRFSIEERERKKIETLKRTAAPFSTTSGIFQSDRLMQKSPSLNFSTNCGYRKRAPPDLLKLVEKNDDIRVTFKEMPILGPSSTAAAQMALTAQSEEDYLAIHRDILENRGQLNQARLTRLRINTA